jgi:FixJ family two-component response regulator
VGCSKQSRRAVRFAVTLRQSRVPMTAATVHVVEDDPAMRDALTLLLQGEGFDVRSYPSAEAFLIELDRSQPIFLLADVRLPDMDGITLYRHLVALGLDPATVVITAHGDVPMAVAALKEGVIDFVEKPFDPALLLESVREARQRAAACSRDIAMPADLCN